MDYNKYGRQLTADEIRDGKHREFIGGMWDEIGRLQASFLIDRGLRPHHRLLDMGCGALRGGLHFIPYLDVGHYYGVDINASLIDAGRSEVRAAGLEDMRPNLAISDDFDASAWSVRFDYGIALSLFTHLPHGLIERCLSRLVGIMAGPFYATYFEAPTDGHEGVVKHPGGIATHYGRDPFHLSFNELAQIADRSGMHAERIGPWDHPRSQFMAAFNPQTQ